MKKKLFLLGAACLALFGTACNDKGCSDLDAHNFHSKDDGTDDCMYRFTTNIHVSGVPASRPSGGSWDVEGNLPDLKVIFFKNESGHVDVVTNIAMDATEATLVPPETMFTYGSWQYEIVDDDAGSTELIATGNFNPLKEGSDGSIDLTNGAISITFNYVVK